MKLFLGVDGGASGTTAVIGDETGGVVATGLAGPVNDPAADVTAVLHRAILSAVGAADVEFESACIGLSGGVENKETAIRAAVRAKHFLLADDALIALTGATGGEPGIVTIAGTGSIAFGRNAQDRTARAGGWGYVFGDEGSAFDIARQALRAALRFEEGWGPATRLHEALLEASEARDANDLLHRVYRNEIPKPRFAQFARVVDQAAAAGDLSANEILKTAAQQLAALAAAVRGQLFARDEIVNFSCAGGVFASTILRERFRMLIELNDVNRFAAPRFEPARGALIEAYRIANMSPY